MQENPLLTDEVIASKIIIVRDCKVMLDADLAELYGVETKRLKEQVRRNLERFPPSFMFELTKDEAAALRSQKASLNRGEHSKYLPFVFTEHGILMLSNVLKSQRAIQVSIRIIDIFVKLRQLLVNNAELWLEIERIKSKLDSQDKNMEIVFQYFDQLLSLKNESVRRRIGYKPDEL
ncbi:MAG TPA: ORF6N domain-containing protein [Bacteroidetes bacterium]|nr:ORF6N domain-containing protein [Bacteroidota bacterium]